jgi:hypothetical protein
MKREEEDGPRSERKDDSGLSEPHLDVGDVLPGVPQTLRGILLEGGRNEKRSATPFHRIGEVHYFEERVI